MTLIQNRFRIQLLALLSGFLLCSCDPVFEPLQDENPFIYSVNGLLDISADTQWVRIMPVREGVGLSPDSGPIDAIVTLEHLGSGDSVVMRDSVIYYRGHSGERGAWTHTFWTTMTLEPEETYRLTVSRSDGKSSEATVTMPERFADPYFIGRNLYIERANIEHLVDVSRVYYFLNTVSKERQRETVPRLQQVERTTDGYFFVNMGSIRGEDLGYLAYDRPWILYRYELFVASGGPGWPDFATLPELTIQIHDSFSNVENGTGFLGAIASKSFPLCSQGGSYYFC